MPLIPNNGWETGDAGGWTFNNGSGPGGDVTVETADASNAIRSGTYALRIRNGGGTGPRATFDYPGHVALRGSVVTFGIYTRRAPGSSATFKLVMFIDDGVGGSSISVDVTDSYALYTTAATVDGASTKLQFGMRLANTIHVHNVDDMFAYAGNTSRATGVSLLVFPQQA